jgi:ferredoxin-NADP reductase/DMSO/TMAO reductase YedYZ heme-binding membrane subunit
VNDPHIWWYVTRSSAIIAWVLMTLSVVWGILLSTRILRKVDNPGWLQDLHKYLGGASLVMVALHVVSLMLDGWLHFSVIEALVPFASEYRTVPVTIGIVGFYLMLAVQGSSLLINRLPRKLWKGIHFSAYGVLVLAAFHAGFTGTDVGTSWYRAVAITLIVLAGVATILRALVGRPAPAVADATSRAASPVRGEGHLDPSPSPGPSGSGGLATMTVPTRTTTIPLLEKREMVVAGITRQADHVLGIRLLPIAGGMLPAWYPGAHVNVHLPNGLERQYSLCGDPADRQHFEIAVLRTERSEGGSRYIHDSLREGMSLQVDGPLNHFELEGANEYLFIAGGIGITPIKAMIESVPARRAWRLAYFGRSRSTMPFLGELLSRYPGQVGVFARDEMGGRADISGVRSTLADVYCCGPESLMSAIADLVPAERMHFERFVPIVRVPTVAPHAVQVTASRSNLRFQLQPGQSILDGLEQNGLPVSGSCRKGVCGTCEVRVLDGRPDHLDSVMSDLDKDELGVMYPCVSGSASAQLVLDI